MRKSWEMKWLAFCIEWHWWFIMRGREKGCKMLDVGEPLSSPKLLVLNDHLSKHCAKVMAETKRYETLAGISHTHSHDYMSA